MSLDPNKTYLVWNGTAFPNSTNAQFKAPAGSTIDWGDGTVETFDTASTTVNTHTYTDGKTEHTIAISGLTSLGYRAFRECSNLTSVTIGNSVTSIDDEAFYNCSSLTSITIPESVTSIGSHAVLGCSSLTRVTIPNSVTSISWDTFAYCSNLTSVTIGNSVTSIGGEAFYNCSSLTSITIPESVTSIGYHAFANCNKLTQLILFPSSPPNLGSDAIPSTISKIYVQQSSKAAYQAATNWTAFASKIVSDNIYLSFVRFNQKNKEYISGKVDGKLTAPTTPTADSVVTIAADGTTGTKALSEIGGGKLYMHSLHMEENDGVFLHETNFNAISSYDSFITKSNILSLNISEFAIVNNGDYIKDSSTFYKLASVNIDGNRIVVNYFENSSDALPNGMAYIDINKDDTRISDHTVTEL